MDEKIVKKLPSGAELRITSAPFADSKELYQALLEEAKGIKLTRGSEHFDVLKEVFCSGFSSKKIESCIWKCMERVTYNNLKIDNDTFEPIAAREDYFEVLFEVGKENILPFTKSLYAQLKIIQGQMENILA